MAASSTERRESGSARQTGRESRVAAAAPSAKLIERVRGRLSSELNARKNRATERLDEVAATVRRMGEPLHEAPYEPLGEYVDEAAGRIARLASDLRERDVEDLAHDLGDLARRRPAVFVGAGLAAGIVAARFLKSSSGEVTPRRRVTSPESGGARERESD